MNNHHPPVVVVVSWCSCRRRRRVAQEALGEWFFWETDGSGADFEGIRFRGGGQTLTDPHHTSSQGCSGLAEGPQKGQAGHRRYIPLAQGGTLTTPLSTTHRLDNNSPNVHLTPSNLIAVSCIEKYAFVYIQIVIPS